LGTPDWTLMGERRHYPVFGGLQFGIVPRLGFTIEDDGRNLITALSYQIKDTGFKLKVGNFGTTLWGGIQYSNAR